MEISEAARERMRAGGRLTGPANGRLTGPANGRHKLAKMPRSILQANGRRNGRLMRGPRNGNWSGRRIGPKWDMIRLKARCAVAMARALKTGRLARRPCEKCGCERVQAHHPNYSKPFEVRWLCQKHHTALHRRKNRHTELRQLGGRGKDHEG